MVTARSRPGRRQTRRPARRVWSRVALFEMAAVLALLAGAAQAQAGLYHVYSCRTPAGVAAPTDGWTSTISRDQEMAVNTCTGGGSMEAYLPGNIVQSAQIDDAGWIYAAP